MNRNTLINIVATGVLVATGALAHAQSYNGRAAVPDANPQSDQQITERVKDKIAVDEPGVASRIAVTTNGGVVTLQGIAMTQQYILKALFDAESVGGVVHVNNRLTLD